MQAKLRVPFLSRLFAERDAVDVALADLAKQGAGMSRVAHACAMLLVILFSAGSLVALSGDAVASLVHGRVDVPTAISVGVSTLLVLCMDVGMVYAASMLRVLNARRAIASEKRVHLFVMISVALLEAGTYLYMSSQYEHPHASAAWVLIIARAAAAPMLAVYLSLARPLPVTSRDILAQAEMASGAGVLRDVSAAANNRNAPLAQKMRVYGAAAIMTAEDRARLDSMINAMLDAPGELTGRVMVKDGNPTLDKPPTGPGTPVAAPIRTLNKRTQQSPVLLLESAGDQHDNTAAQASASRSNTSPVRTRKRSPKASVEKQVRRVWRPDMSVTQLQRAAGISRNSAAKWTRVLAAELEDPQQRVDLAQ